MWTDWMYTHCSVTCGNGTRTAFRKVRKHANEKLNGTECVGASTEVETCKLEPCPTPTGNSKHFIKISKYKNN